MGLSAAVEAQGLRFEIGGRALVDDVTLAICFGELVAVVGPNGAGKSTLVRLLAGELEPSAGRALLDGRHVQDFRAGELALVRAVLPQESTLQFAFTVGEIVAMGRYPHRARGPEARATDEDAIARALAATDVAHLVHRTWTTLSGGERARTIAARVLAQDTPVLFLDEPTSALDLRHQQLVIETMRRLVDRERAIVAVLHDLTLAAAVADRVAVLHEGRLEAFAPPWEALTEERLSAVFGLAVEVARHPHLDRPLVLPALGARTDMDSTRLRRENGARDGRSLC